MHLNSRQMERMAANSAATSTSSRPPPRAMRRSDRRSDLHNLSSTVLRVITPSRAESTQEVLSPSPPSPAQAVNHGPTTLSPQKAKGNEALLASIVAPAQKDMEVMNVNLKNVVGDRHPMLMAAAEQIFGAGGKKLRPVLVFLVARATASLMDLR